MSITGRVPDRAERFASFKRAPRFAGSSLRQCEVARTALEISYSQHVGQATVWPPIVVAICSALAPQTGQSMSGSIRCDLDAFIEIVVGPSAGPGRTRAGANYD